MTATKTMTVEEYLEFEKGSELRHEFVDGAILAMAGSSLRHNEIIFNIRAALTKTTREKHCAIASESLRVHIEGRRYRYPDVVVSCDPGNNEYLLENPCFIAEVLSESTAPIDYEDKLREYTRLASFAARSRASHRWRARQTRDERVKKLQPPSDEWLENGIP